MSFWHKVRQREKQRLGGRAGWLGRHHGGVRREGDGTRGPGQGRSSPGTPVRWAGLASVEGCSLRGALTSQDPPAGPRVRARPSRGPRGVPTPSPSDFPRHSLSLVKSPRQVSRDIRFQERKCAGHV